MDLPRVCVRWDLDCSAGKDTVVGDGSAIGADELTLNIAAAAEINEAFAFAID